MTWGLHHGHPRPPWNLSGLPQLRLEEEEEEGRGVEGRGGTELSELSRFGVRLVGLSGQQEENVLFHLLGLAWLVFSHNPGDHSHPGRCSQAHLCGAGRSPAGPRPLSSVSLLSQSSLAQADTLQLICVALGGRLSCQCHVMLSKHIYKFKKLHNSSLTSFITSICLLTEHAKKISDIK